jgi:hypothetical protein
VVLLALSDDEGDIAAPARRTPRPAVNGEAIRQIGAILAPPRRLTPQS